MPSAISIVKQYFPQVETVKDASRDVAIEVTPRDVSKAERKKHRTCAMAMACKREEHLEGVIISIKSAYLIKGTVAIRYSMPESASREVISFDRGAQFEPGEYRLKVPIRKLGDANKGNGHSKGKGNGGLRSPKHTTEGIRTVLGSKNIS